MSQQEQLQLYINHIYETCLSTIQLWDTRDVNAEMHYAPLIKQVVDIEKILTILKNEMVEDASNLG